MNKHYEELAARMRETMMLASAAGVLAWDQETKMPERASGMRAEQMATLSGIIHDKLIDPQNDKLLAALERTRKGLTPSQRICVREWRHDYDRSTKLPRDLIEELARTSTLAQSAWIKARAADDFSLFAPWLKKTFALKRRQAEAVGYSGHPYDALLDDYEPGMTVAALDPVIANLREGLVPIVERIRRSKTRVDASCLTRRYPEDEQEALCTEVAQALGVDFTASRLDRSAHPFMIGIAPTDVRITTRFNERFLPQALFGVIHESGHALYEQGLPEKAFGTPLGEAVSTSMHESQSRFWENMVGRTRPFAGWLLPKLRRHFPQSLKGVSADAFYRALSRVRATPIRVEADEVTYNLHICLRYEIEKELVADTIRVSDLPRIWNERMQAMVGVRPKNDAQGVLQDIHWAHGMIGYFPTYLLGNLYSAQLRHTIRRTIPEMDALVAKGEFAPILQWLRTKIHRHARRFPAAELIRRATGKPLDARFFLEYVKEKYGPIYKITW